ncbi:MAG TPA: hypothetical protein VFZ00_10905 [Solirubrobacter sp.]|nr:hypothetical protein [Solirubrobacter sp.]
MWGTRSRWAVGVATVALAVPVATAHGHPLDFMYGADPPRQIGATTGGVSTFLQREVNTPGYFELVGHNPLRATTPEGDDDHDPTAPPRGMNAAIAVHKNYVYIGSRTDGNLGPDGSQNVNHAGIMVVEVSDPTKPKVVHEIGPPFEGLTNESSRELRVWRSQEILIVLHTNCGGASAHLCTQPNRSSMRFYDISGEHAKEPVLIHQNNRDTHEFFVWEDPKNPERALMFASSAGSQFQIYDMSPLLNEDPAARTPTVLFSGPHGFGNSSGSGIHSFSVSNDGKRLFHALLTRGFGIGDVSAYTDNDPATTGYRLITPAANRVSWPGPGAHSAVKLWNKDWVYVSDEVYGTITASGHGCPWGWTRFIDIADPTRPVVRSDYRIPENQPAICSAFNPPRTSYSAHNPTLTQNIAFSTWHSGGFQAMDISDPTNVTQLAEYKPPDDPDAPGGIQPLVGTEDPRLSSDNLPERGDEKVVMWSYPVIQDGLIYTVDLRNGLYILKYHGPHEDEVNQITFLEGNSNQGDAMCIEPVPGATNVQCDTERETSAGGTVPATLSLSIPGEAAFGAFTPGVSATYEASTTANVISSAGDATLSVADPSPDHTGHLVNGTFFLPSKVQARARNAADQSGEYADVGSSAAPTNLLTYTGPISNDVVTLGFRQAIGATDALRTGPYSKTLTFTLSTTTP